MQTVDSLDRGLGFAVDGNGVLSLSDALVSTSTVSGGGGGFGWGLSFAGATSRLTVVVRTGGVAEWAAISAAVAVGATVGTDGGEFGVA